MSLAPKTADPRDYVEIRLMSSLVDRLWVAEDGAAVHRRGLQLFSLRTGSHRELGLHIVAPRCRRQLWVKLCRIVVSALRRVYLR